MKTLAKVMCALLAGEEGPTVTEYAMMLALIIAICIVLIASIGNKVSAMFGDLNSGLPTGS